MNDIETLVPEFDKNPKGFAWYLIAFLISILFGFVSYILKNYTFIAIIGLAWITIIMRETRTPALLSLVIGNLGIKLGNKYWEYKDIKNFSVFSIQDKNYLIFTPVGKFQLNVKVPVKNPDEMRTKLINYLPHVEYQEPLVEGLARILRI